VPVSNRLSRDRIPPKSLAPATRDPTRPNILSSYAQFIGDMIRCKAWGNLPNPIAPTCPHPSVRLSRSHYLLQLLRCRPAHAAETAIISIETGVAISGAFGLPQGGTAHVCAGFPGTAAHDSSHVLV